MIHLEKWRSWDSGNQSKALVASRVRWMVVVLSAVIAGEREANQSGTGLKGRVNRAY